MFGSMFIKNIGDIIICLVYPALTGVLVFGIASLSKNDADGCNVGGLEANSNPDYDNYVATTALLFIAGSAVGFMMMQFSNEIVDLVFGRDSEMAKRLRKLAYLVGSILLHSTVAAYVMVVYGLATTDCVQDTFKGYLRKDVFVTYVSWCNVLLFSALGIASVPLIFGADESSKDISDKKPKKSISAVKLADCIIRLVAFILFSVNVIGEEGVFVHVSENITSAQNISLVTNCTNVIDQLNSGDTPNYAISFEHDMKESLTTSAIVLTSTELAFRLFFFIVYLVHMRSGSETDEKEKEWLENNSVWVTPIWAFEFLLTIASHVLAGLLVSGVIQTAMYEQCEVYEKTTEFRTAMLLMTSTLVTSVLHVQTVRLTRQLDDNNFGKFMELYSPFTYLRVQGGF